jgi:hypothetical protein
MESTKRLSAVSALRTGRRRLAAVTTMAVIAAVFTFVSAPAASADTIGPITFETSQFYVVGDINGQPVGGSLPHGNWSKTGPYDVEVVPVATFADAAGYGFNAQALRISDAVTSGSFGDQTFTPGLADEAGEKNAYNAGLSGGLRQPRFEMSFQIGTTKAIEQPGLHMSVSPDRGDGARMSYLRFEDQVDGVHVFFTDVTDPGRVPDGDTFNESDIATIDRDHAHLIRLTIAFKNGPAHDVVMVFVDGVRKVTGTTWEDYYRYDSEQASQGNKVPTVDKVLFRESGDAHTANLGQGFLLDHVTLKSSGRKA